MLVWMFTSKSAGTGCTSGDTRLLARRDCRTHSASLTIWRGEGRRSTGYMVSCREKAIWSDERILADELVPFIQHIPLQVFPMDHISKVT